MGVKISNIDFTPLDQLGELKKTRFGRFAMGATNTFNGFKKFLLYTMIMYGLFTSFFITYPFSDATSDISFSNISVLKIVIALIGLVLVIVLIYLVHAYYRRQQAILDAFRSKNRLGSEEASSVLEHIGASSLLQQIDGEVFSTYINQDAEAIFRLFEYAPARRGVLRYAVATILLDRNVPHIIIDTKQNNFYKDEPPANFHPDDRWRLEGNFGEHFAVFASHKSQAETLSILTPDFMARLIDHYQSFDVEIVNNTLIVCKGIVLDSRQDFEDMFSALDAIHRHVQKKIKTWPTTREVAEAPILGSQKIRTDQSFLGFFRPAKMFFKSKAGFVLLFLLLMGGMAALSALYSAAVYISELLTQR